MQTNQVTTNANASAPNAHLNGSCSETDLRSICRRNGVFPLRNEYMLMSVLHAFQKRSSELANHPGRYGSVSSGDYLEWKNAFQSFQQDLALLNEMLIPKRPPVSEPTVASQPLTGEPKASQSEPKPIQPEPLPNQPGPIPSQAEPTSIKSISPIEKEDVDKDHTDEAEDDDNCPDADAEGDDEDDDLYYSVYPEAGQFAQDVAHACVDVQYHLAGRSPLDKLTPQHQAAIILLLEDYSERVVAKIIAEDPPVGMKIRASRAAINRFRKRYLEMRRKRFEKQAIKISTDVLDDPDSTNESVRAASEKLINMRLLARAADSSSNDRDLRWLVHALTTLQRRPPTASPS